MTDYELWAWLWNSVFFPICKWLSFHWTDRNMVLQNHVGLNAIKQKCPQDNPVQTDSGSWTTRKLKQPAKRTWFTQIQNNQPAGRKVCYKHFSLHMHNTPCSTGSLWLWHISIHLQFKTISDNWQLLQYEHKNISKNRKIYCNKTSYQVISRIAGLYTGRWK